MGNRLHLAAVHVWMACLLLSLPGPAVGASPAVHMGSATERVVTPATAARVDLGERPVVLVGADTGIRAARVVSEGPREVVLDVDYAYRGEQGEQVFASAHALAGSRRLPFGYVPGAVARGVGTTRVTLRRIDHDGTVLNSDGVQLELYVGGGGAFVSARFGLAKSWLRDDATLPVQLGVKPPAATPDEGPALGGPVAAGTPTEAVVARRFTPEGIVEVAYADGRRVQRFQGGYTIIFPDGRQQRVLMSNVQPPTPPAPPPGSSLERWLDGEAAKLLDVLRLLVGQDEAQITAYLAREPADASAFARIAARREAIAYMLQP